MKQIQFSMIALSLLFAGSLKSLAQTDDLILSSYERYMGTQNIIKYAAEIMPEELYQYKPTNEVRSYGEMIGHIIESKYFFCAQVLGEKHDSDIEGKVINKKELILELEKACDYCEKAHESMSNKTALEKIQSQGTLRPKLEVLNTNSMHAIMHYGNLVIYLRLNGLIPPTSDRDFMKKLMGID